MNLRCFYCQTPFTLGRPEMLAALQRMEAENLNHYDAHCPRCRRANSISRERIEMFFPNWRQVAEEQAANTPEPMSTAAPPSESTEEEPMAPAASMEEPAMEAQAEPMKPAAKKPGRKRAGSAKKTKPAAAKKPAKKTTMSKAKMVSKPKAKAKPSATKKTTSKSKKK